MSSPITFTIIKRHTITPMEDSKEEPSEKLETNESEINEASIKGEPGTGFEMPEQRGDFHCWNCEYYDDSVIGCDQKDMKEKSKRPRLADGKVLVHPYACCEFVERTGEYCSYQEMSHGPVDDDEDEEENK